MKENMRLGGGYNEITHMFVRGGVEVLEGNQADIDANRIRSLVDDAQGDILEESFSTLREAHTLVSTNFSLSATFQEFGLSLDVNAKDEQFVDSTKTYYIFRKRIIESGREIKATPALIRRAQQIFNIDFSKDQADIDEQTALVSKITGELANLKATLAPLVKQKTDVDQAVVDTKKTWDAAKKTYGDLASEAKKTEQIYEEKVIEQQNAAGVVDKKNIEIAIKDADLKKANTDLDKKKKDAEAVRAKAVAGITQEQIEKFYKTFGSHYVSSVFSGRECSIFAKADKHSVKQIQSNDVKTKVNLKYVNLGGEHSRVHDQSESENTVRAFVKSYGMSADSPSTGSWGAEAVKEIFKKDNYLQPAIIEVGLTPYSDLLLDMGVKPDIITAMGDNIKSNKETIIKLQDLRADLLSCYELRYYHDYDEKNWEIMALQVADGDDREYYEKDPHNVRLRYIFDYLKAIIKALNHNITTLSDNICQSSSAVSGLISDDGISKIKENLNCIRQELAKRASFRLLRLFLLAHHMSSSVEIDKFVLHFPRQAEELYLSVFTVDKVGLDVGEFGELPKPEFKKGQPLPDFLMDNKVITKADHALKWSDPELAIELLRHRKGKFVPDQHIRTFSSVEKKFSVAPEKLDAHRERKTNGRIGVFFEDDYRVTTKHRASHSSLYAIRFFAHTPSVLSSLEVVTKEDRENFSRRVGFLRGAAIRSIVDA